MNCKFRRKEFSFSRAKFYRFFFDNVKVSSTNLSQKDKRFYNLGTICFSSSTIIISNKNGPGAERITPSVCLYNSLSNVKGTLLMHKRTVFQIFTLYICIYFFIFTHTSQTNTDISM